MAHNIKEDGSGRVGGAALSVRFQSVHLCARDASISLRSVSWCSLTLLVSPSSRLCTKIEKKS